MTMTIWDGLVIFVVVAQAVALVSVAVAVLKLKQGPVTATIIRTKSLIGSGKAVAAAGMLAYTRNRPHIERMQAELLQTGAAFLGTKQEFDLHTAGPREVLALWAKWQGGLGTVRQGLSLFKHRPTFKRNTATVPGPKGAVKKASEQPTLAHRMGLVPPIIQKLGWVKPAFGIARGTYRTLKAQGILR